LKASDFNWYCPDNGVSIEWIEERAVYLMENFIEADSVYMSEDIHKQFMWSMVAKTRHPVGGHHTVSTVTQIITSGGPLIIKMVPGMCNFCHVGTNASYSDLIRIQVDEEFEKVFLKDCERE
jgi:hypothetical protein